MDGEHLHAMGGDIDLSGGEAVLDRLRSGEERQESGDRGGRIVGVIGHHMGEFVEMFTSDRTVGADRCAGLSFDTDAHDPFDVADQFRQRLTDSIAQ